MAPQRRRCIVTAKQSAVKRYIVKLSDAERERLDALTHMGKHPARLLTKARILLKADASEAGEGWSDSRIAEALDTSTDTVARTRQQLVASRPCWFASIRQPRPDRASLTGPRKRN